MARDTVRHEMPHGTGRGLLRPPPDPRTGHRHRQAPGPGPVGAGGSDHRPDLGEVAGLVRGPAVGDGRCAAAPGTAGSSAGSAARQAGSASGQRGAKEHPSGSVPAAGGVPGIGTSTVADGVVGRPAAGRVPPGVPSTGAPSEGALPASASPAAAVRSAVGKAPSRRGTAPSRPAGETDIAKSDALYSQADAGIWAEVHSIELYQRPQILAVREGLANFGASGLGDGDYVRMGWRK